MNKTVTLTIFDLVFRSQIGPLLALVFIMAVFAATEAVLGGGVFLSTGNLRSLVNSASFIVVPALGMTIIIIAGGIDLSAGTALTLCGTVLVTVLKISEYSADEPGFIFVMITALGLTALTGCACGFFNGALISLTKVVPFIITLGSMTIFLGIGEIISAESTVYAPKENIPDWLGGLCYTGSNASNYGFIPYVPTSAIIAVVLAILVALLLRYTVFGRNIFALGSSESTARLCGINIPLTILSVYTLAGLFVAFGGLLYYANVKNGNPSDGPGKELEIIAAVVLGGGSLSGGRGSIFGTMVGAMIIVVIRSGCTLLSIPNTYTHITIGAIIIIAAIVDQLRHGSPEWLFRLLPSKTDD